MSARQYDAVVIPGGGLDQSTGAPAPWVVARLDCALQLDEQTRYYIVLSRGTPHRPAPLDDAGYAIDEAAASARYLIARGVSAERVLLDSWSLDTIGNAYFARAMITDVLELRQLCVVTSEFHMPRTRTIFDWVFALDHAQYSMHYKVAPDVGMAADVRNARCEKEASSLGRLRSNTIPSISSMMQLARFVLIQHGAYNAASCTRKRVQVDAGAQASY